jgi:hypothetical protein
VIAQALWLELVLAAPEEAVEQAPPALVAGLIELVLGVELAGIRADLEQLAGLEVVLGVVLGLVASQIASPDLGFDWWDFDSVDWPSLNPSTPSMTSQDHGIQQHYIHQHQTNIILNTFQCRCFSCRVLNKQGPHNGRRFLLIFVGF